MEFRKGVLFVRLYGALNSSTIDIFKKDVKEVIIASGIMYVVLNTYNLEEITKEGVKEIKALNDKVYVFENPTVFYELLIRTENIPVTLICTSGQPNISSLILLDKLKTELKYDIQIIKKHLSLVIFSGE